MPSYTSNDIRNVALVGHAGCGKTTLIERLLEATGVIGRMGTVEDGNTVCDYEPEEKHHKHSLNSAVVHFDHEGKRINIIDTPGYPDFIGQAIAVLPAVETLLIAIDATKGIENVTRRMKNLAAERKIPRAIVINKLDNAENLEELVNLIRESFGSECLPINLPKEGGRGIEMVFHAEHGAKTDFSSVEAAHQAIVDQSVEADDALMEKYLESGEVSKEDLVASFKKSMVQGHLVPIFFMSAKSGVGVPEFLHAVAELFPAPTDRFTSRILVRESADSEETPLVGAADPSKPFIGHVFRVTTDPFVGKLSCFRVHQGTLKAGDSIYIDQERKPVRFAHIFHLRGKDHHEVPDAIPGDIIAVPKIEELHYNSIVYSETNVESLRFDAVPQPRPMFGLAVSAAKRGEEGKIAQSLARLAEEDPTFTVERDPTTHETVIRGLGELHTRIMIEKLDNRFHVKVETAPPKIAYKETITAKAEGHHRHKKQTGGAGQFGEVFLRVEPLPADSEATFEFADETFGGSVPKQFMPAIEKGVRQVLEHGAIAGYPLQGVRVAVYDGKHHPVDSKEVAFATAGRRAFVDAVSKARPALLEPYVRMEITIPQDYMGDVTGDISGRRGRVQGTDILPGGLAVITTVAPLAEVMSYASALKAMTQGTGSYSMEYSHDEPAPANVQAEVVAAYKPKEEED